jgi:YVTN family beta-propeller protein
MRFSLPWVFLRRSSFDIVSCFLACAALVAGLAAQTAHFSYAVSSLGSGFGFPTAPAVDGANGLLYVTNGSQNTVSIVNLATNTVVGTVNVGSDPVAIAISHVGPSAGDVYVVNEASQTVSVIHSATNTVIATVPVGNGPDAIAVSETGPQAGDVYVANGISNTVSIIDSATNTVIATVPVGNGPGAIAVSGTGPEAGDIYVANENTNTVSIINPATNTVIATVPVGSSPDAIAVSGTGPQAGEVYVANGAGNTVSIVDPATNTVIATVPVGSQPDAIAVSGAGPSAGDVYVANGAGNTVSIINPATNTVTSALPVGSNPDAIAVDSSGNVYVANAIDSSVIEMVTGGLNFYTATVGATTAARALTFTFDTGGTISAPAVRTLGALNLDFTDAGTGTCTTNGTSFTYNEGDTCTVNVTFKPRYPGTRYGAVELTTSGGAVIAAAHVYGTGMGPQIIFKGNPAPIALGAGFSYPEAVAVDGNGNLFVSDFGNGFVKEILAAGGYTTVLTLGGSFSNPWGIAVDGSGNVFVSDRGNGAVKEILADGGYTTVLTLGSGFSNPQGLALDGSGNVFVADGGPNAIKEILAADGYTTVKTLVGGFSYPTGLALDGSGNIFVSDSNNDAIYEISASSGYTAVQTLNPNTYFYFPFGVAVDGAGNVFVADTFYNRVQELMASTGYTTSTVLRSGFDSPFGVGVDPSGNVLVLSNDNGGTVAKLDYSDAPTLNFAAGVVGGTSSDSPRTVTIENDGNQTLTFAQPATGSNPSVSTNFSWDNASTCAQTTSGSPAAFTLAAGVSCTVAVDFTPIASGTISGSVALTDNSLNASPGTTQSITLNGTATDPPAKLVFGTAPAPLIVAGGNAGSAITVQEQTASGVVVISATDSITLTVTGPHSYTQTYNATAVSGVATFDLSGAALTDPGSYTYTASFLGLASGVATETVVAIAYSDPETFVGAASRTQTATLFMSLNFTLGSIGVLTQGAPNLDFQPAAGGSCTVGAPYTAGQTCTVNYTFQPMRPGSRYGAVVLYDNASPANAVATVYLQGMGDAPQVVFSGNNPQSTLGVGFDNPQGLAIDGSGNVFVADYLNDSIKEVLATGGYTTVQTVGSGFSLPTAVAVDGAGNVFVADWGNNAVKEIMAASSYATVKTLGSFSTPAGIAVDGSGNVFVSDAFDGWIKEIMAAGGYTTAKTVKTGLDYPFGLAVDGAGNIFVADFNAFDTGADAVKEILVADGYSTVMTLGGGFHRPSGVAVDAVGNVFVASYGDGTVKEILAAGGHSTVNTLGGSFNNPVGVTLDGSANVFVADRGNSTVSMLDFSDPPALTFATTAAGLTSTDSPGTTTVSNDGNVDLVFLSLAYAADFPDAAGGATDCASVPGLSAGDSCTLGIDFSPLVSTLTGASTPLSENVILTDNNLNAANATQSIGVTGTATAFTIPVFLAPAGGTLAGSTDTFSWDPGNAANFQFRLGTVLGANDVFSSRATTQTSFTVSSLPTNGLTLYACLYYRVGGTWHAIYRTWIEAGAPTPPTLLSPTPGSTLTGNSVTFAWDPGTETKFKFTLGTFLGGNGLYGSGPISSTTLPVTNLPTTGTIHARLYYLVNGTWNSIDYVYYTPTYISSPAPNSTLSGSTVTFNWAPGSATAFKLQLGHFQGGFGLYGSGITHSTSATVSNLPTDGKPVYARLSYLVNGVWQFTDYVYTAP